MLKAFQALFGTKQQAASELDAGGIATSARVTRAILAITAATHRNTEEWLKENGLKLRPESGNVLTKIDNAIVTVTLIIVNQAMDNAFGNAMAHSIRSLTPGDSLPKGIRPNDVHLVATFAVVVTTAIALALKSEGTRPDLNCHLPVVAAIDCIFLLLSANDKAAICKIGMEHYSTLTKSGEPKVLEWYNMVIRLVRLYILDDPTLRASGFPRLLGGSLNSLLAIGR